MAGPATAIIGKTGWEPIRIEDVKALGGEGAEFKDNAALSLVIQDYNRARGFVEEAAWMEQWQENDILYQSPLMYNDNDPERARASRFTVNNQTNTMSDAVKGGMFAEKPPFMARPRGDTSQQDVDAWTALLDVLLDRMNFQYWVGLGIEGLALDGTAIWKAGWGTRTRKVNRRVQKASPVKLTMPAGTDTVPTTESDAFEIKVETITESYPWIEGRMLGTTLFDPGWRTPNRPDLCGYAIDVDYVTWYDLENLRDQDCYTLPPSETLKQFFFANDGNSATPGTSVEEDFSHSGSPISHADNRATATTSDPLGQKMMVLERWDENMVVTTLSINNLFIVIRNEFHGLGRMPHFSANWRNKKNAGYGIGLGVLVGGDQRIEQGVLNHALNLLAYQFNPAILHAAGSNTPTSNRVIRAGGFFAVTPLGNDVRNSMAVMEMPKIPAEAWQMITYIKGSSEETSGADSTFMQGNLGGRGSSAARTATGASSIASASANRLKTPVENLEQGLFIPFLYMLVDMVKTKMPLNEVRDILSSKLGKLVTKDFDPKRFIESDFRLEMLAGAKMAAKTAMAQQLPQMLQVAQNPALLEQLHNEGKTIDFEVLFDVMFAASEYRMEDQVVREMTDQEKQSVQANHAPSVKVQEAVAAERIKGQNALAVEDRRSQNQLTTTLTEQAIAHDSGELPMLRAEGLVERKADEGLLTGQGPTGIAGA